MKMLARLKYLADEGFEIAALSGYDDPESDFNAKILFLKPCPNGRFQVCSELFTVDSEEMERCCNLFFTYLADRG